MGGAVFQGQSSGLNIAACILLLDRVLVCAFQFVFLPSKVAEVICIALSIGWLSRTSVCMLRLATHICSCQPTTGTGAKHPYTSLTPRLFTLAS
eukprot:jgi/Chrzof1/11157/Cz05g26020.t1